MTKEQKIAELGKKAREMYSSVFKNQNQLSENLEIIEPEVEPFSDPLTTTGALTQNVIYEEHNYSKYFLYK